MLSHRAARNAANEDLPWRFAPGLKNRYHPVNNPDGVVVFGTAENPLIHKELADFVAKKVVLSPDIFTYRYSSPGGQRFPKAMAAHITRHFKPHQEVLPGEIVAASMLTGIHELLGYSIGDPGDGILTIPPVYGRFELDFGNTAGLKIAYAEMGDTDPLDDGQKIVQRLQATLTKSGGEGFAIRALLIVNPNNPLGRCYPSATLKQLMQFCQANGLHFICDEVYALSVYETGEAGSKHFCSALSIDVRGLIEPDRLHVLYGMSKDLGAAGLRIGCLITRNSLLRKAMLANIRFHATSGPSVAIASTILEDRSFVDSLLTTSRQRLARNRQIACTRLAEAGIDWHRGGNAGFFLYIDLSPWMPNEPAAANPEFELAGKLLKAGVGLHPGEEHYERRGWFRLVFSVERDVLEEGLKRLTKALAGMTG